MQDDSSTKKSDDISSKDVKSQDDETRIVMVLGKTKSVTLKKSPLLISFLAVIILIALFALLAFYLYFGANKNHILPHKLNQVSSNRIKSLNLDTTLTSYGNEFDENHNEEQASVSAYALFDGTKEADDSSTMTSVDDLFAEFSNNYESTTEPFSVTVPETVPTEHAKGQFCEEIHLISIQYIAIYHDNRKTEP